MAEAKQQTGKQPEAKPQAEQKPAEAKVTEPKPAAKPEKAPYVRTKIRTTNPEKGVYRTLNGQFEIRAGSKAGTWDLLEVAGSQRGPIEAGIKGWDRALDRIVERNLATVERLNQRPPKPAAPAAAKPEAKEEGVSERRSGATGPAPKKTRPATETVHTRRSRAVKVG